MPRLVVLDEFHVTVTIPARLPDDHVREIRRVLSPGGELIFLTPNTAGYTTILSRLIPDRLKAGVISFIADWM